MLRTYNPKSVSIIYAGSILEGFADGDMITVARNEDSAAFERSAQGGGTRVLSSDKSGRVTIRLQQTSPSNATLTSQLQAMERSGGGIAAFLLKDNDSGDVIQATSMWPVKPPDSAYANTASNREWVLETDNLEMLINGQTS